MGPTDDEIALFDEVTLLARDVWLRSRGVEGTISNPKLVSTILFKRLHRNVGGFVVLWRAGHYAEAEIIVRSAVESAICIVANFKMGDDFPRLLRRDAAKTLEQKIKLERKFGNEAFAENTEAALRFLENGFSEGEKAAYLDWQKLAEVGEAPLLYGFYKNMSGMSSHVTGLSVIRDVADDDMADLQTSVRGLGKRNYFNIMSGSTLHATLVQAGIIDDAEAAERALVLVERMNVLSRDWPGGAES